MSGANKCSARAAATPSAIWLRRKITISPYPGSFILRMERICVIPFIYSQWLSMILKTMTRRILPILLSLTAILSASAVGKAVFTIDSTAVQQQIDCFGASDAWSMRFMGEMPEATQNEVARLLFSSGVDASGNPDGIGLSIWRFNIGAGSVEQGDSSLINSGTRTAQTTSSPCGMRSTPSPTLPLRKRLQLSWTASTPSR